MTSTSQLISHFRVYRRCVLLGYARRARGGTRADRVFFFWVWVRRSSSSWSVWGKSICLGLVWSTWTIRGSILWFLYWIIRCHIHQPPRPPAHSTIPSPRSRQSSPPPVPLARHTSTSHPTRRSIEIGTQAQDISPRMWLG